MCLASSCRLRLIQREIGGEPSSSHMLSGEEKCAVTFLSSLIEQPTSDHPLVDKGGEYNPDQVSFVRARNVNGKCGAKNK